LNEVTIAIIDPTPHLIRYVLGMITNLMYLADVAYSLGYKLIKIFESNNSNNYMPSADFSKFIVRPVVDYVIHTLPLVDGCSVELWDDANKEKA
jgi:hypothetical protein